MEGLQQQVLLAAELQQQQQQQQQQMQGAGGVVREAERPIYALPPVCQGDFRTFTKTFKIYLSLQRIFNLRDKKSSLMLAASTPKNATKLQSFYTDMEDETISYDVFESRLIGLFCPQSESLMARREFLSLRQGADEDFVSFWGQKYSLYNLAFPQENRAQNQEQERFMVEEFVKSLANLEVKRSLFRKITSLTPINLREEITNAIQSEDTLCTFGLSETGTRNGLIYSEQMTSHNATREEPMDLSELKAGKCHKCNKEGHWARDCESKDQNKRYNNHRNDQFPSRSTKKETRSCNRCYTKGHLKSSCRIPEARLEATRKKNKESKANKSKQPTSDVRQIEAREDDEDQDDANLIESLGINAVRSGFRKGQ
jgi:hypothetical protein